MGMMRSAGHALHRLFAWNATLADAYLRLWRRVLAVVPEGRLLTHLRNNLVTASWPGLHMHPMRVSFAGGLKVWVRPRPQTIAFTKGLFHREFAHEPEVFRFLQGRMEQYDAVVEVGANIGVYTVFFSRCLSAARNARVLAYEPSRQAFADLQEHVSLNDCHNVTAFNCAVSPGPKRVAFYENSRDWMKGSLDRETATWFGGADQPNFVQSVSGEDIQPLLANRDRVLLKIDVVGSEAMVLTALEDLIRERKPDIVLGVWERNLASLNALSFLRETYDLWKIESEGLTVRDRFSDEGYCNYFLRPRNGAAVGRP